MRKTLALCMLFFLGNSNASGQWLGTFAFESGYSDNMFNSASRAEGLSTDYTLMYGFFPDDAHWAVNYSGAITTFNRYPDRLFSTHVLASSVVFPYGEYDANNISILASGSFRVDKAEYDLYDYQQALLSAALKQYMLPSLLGQLSYQARVRQYPHFDDLGYLEHLVQISGVSFFDTRTSIRLHAEFGFKKYLSTSVSVLPQVHGGISGTNSSLSAENGGNGHGYGQQGNSNPRRGSTGAMGSGRSMEYLLYDEANTSQARLMLNIGQGLNDDIGIALRALRRWNLSDRGRAFVGGAVEFFGEEELFDDPYGYESSELSLTVTYLLPWSMRMQVSGAASLKNYGYPATLDYDTPGVDERSDMRSGAWMNLSKRVAGKWLLFTGLDLTLRYSWIRNQSNSAWFDYSANALSFGLSTDF